MHLNEPKISAFFFPHILLFFSIPAAYITQDATEPPSDITGGSSSASSGDSH